MDYLTEALIVLGTIRQKETAARLADQNPPETPDLVAYQKRLSEFRKIDYPPESEASSLQQQLLDYFEGALGLPDAAGLLRAAEDSRQALLKSVEQLALLGVDLGDKKMSSLVGGFTEAELYILNQVVQSTDPAQEAAKSQVVGLVVRKFAQGLGIKLVEYLARRLRHQRTKTTTPKIMRSVEGVHPVHLVIAKMWTAPNCPLWMTPSTGASRIVSEAAGRQITNKAFNTLVKDQKLKRMPTKFLDRFFSAHLLDPVGQKLREAFASACDFTVEEVRRGRRPGGTG